MNNQYEYAYSVMVVRNHGAPADPDLKPTHASMDEAVAEARKLLPKFPDIGEEHSDFERLSPQGFMSNDECTLAVFVARRSKHQGGMG
ncbi:MAG: hypothetical protein ACI85K_003006 [Hyphomicrobiaceae bacterium]|jgi:hypothetical protein